MHGFSGHFRFATPAPPYSKARTEPWHSFESDPIWQTKMYLKILSFLPLISNGSECL